MREKKPTKSEPRKAYSYLRFSTAEQRAGDSFRRQTDLAKRYAAANGLVLDEQLSYHDLGVSGFSGANAQRGKLAEFLDAVQRAVVPKGSYLLVESLDRISRQNPYDALSILQRIVDSGVTLVTLMGEPKVYNSTTVRQNPMALMEFLLIATRAHEESATKQRRAKEAWKASISKAAKGEARGASSCPGWIKPTEDGKAWELVADRAAIVRRIFELAKKGAGKGAIARTLNSESVPPFDGASRWWSSYVYRIINNRAVLGEHTPKEKIEDPQTGAIRRVAMEPIKGYYPAAISKRTWEDVQAVQRISSRRGRHAHHEIANIFGSLAKCPQCGAMMTRKSPGKSTPRGWPYLVCSAAKNGLKNEDGKLVCVYKSVGYERLEQTFLEAADAVAEDAPKASARGRQIDREIRNAENAREACEEQLAHLLSVAAGVAGPRPVSLVSKIQEMEAGRLALTKELETLRNAAASVDKSLVQSRLDEMVEVAAKLRRADSTEAPPLRTALNAILRRLLKAVVVDYRAGFLRFEWHHTENETGLLYTFPEEKA